MRYPLHLIGVRLLDAEHKVLCSAHRHSIKGKLHCHNNITKKKKTTGRIKKWIALFTGIRHYSPIQNIQYKHYSRVVI